MFDHDTDAPRLEELVIYESDEVIVDGSDPSTYIVCHTAEDIHRALDALLPHQRDVSAHRR